MEWAVRGGPLTRVELDIQVPPEFPERYHKALIRAADQCAVRRTIAAPPAFHVSTSVVTSP
jgi:ribosomal protein S12 methylthiotransferase accessory factor